MAIFLDRDGVLNRPVIREGRPVPPDTLAAFELLPGVAEACRLFKEACFLLVVVTNQPDVGRGTQSRTTVEAMHVKLCAWLPIDRIEVCYDSGDELSSLDRKPKPGMLLRAARELGIDLSRSYMVGDRWRDIDCGHAAGCTTIWIRSNYRESLRKPPHHTVGSLLEAAQLIVGFSAAVRKADR